MMYLLPPRFARNWWRRPLVASLLLSRRPASHSMGVDSLPAGDDGGAVFELFFDPLAGCWLGGCVFGALGFGAFGAVCGAACSTPRNASPGATCIGMIGKFCHTYCVASTTPSTTTFPRTTA